MKRSFLISLAVLVLAACAGVATPAATPAATPTATPSAMPSVTPTVAPDPLPVSPDSFIVYQREGGFAGTSDQWTIYPTGRVVDGAGAVWEVSQEQIAPLFALVESAGFQALPMKYMPSGVCNDCFTYTLTVVKQDHTQTLTFVDGGDWPPLLHQAVSALQKIVAR